MSLWVHMSAVITRHSGGALAAMRFLTAISKLHAVNLITSGSVNGSTSRPVSEVSMFPIIGSILSVIIFFLYSVVSFLIAGFIPQFFDLPGFWYRAVLTGGHFVSLHFFTCSLSLLRRLAVDSLSDFIQVTLGPSTPSLSMFSLVELSHCRE